LLLPDVQPLLGGGVEVTEDAVLGPRLDEIWRAVETAARAGNSIHLIGETGTGKDVAARHYHAKGPRKNGPYIAVNCAAIPVSLAERLLFGAKRGAYSGAETDTEGYLTSAHKGTLFLDELGELPLEVQAKLLRAVDTREVLPLGASRASTVDVALVSASHGELREAITANKFRDDLYFRLCQNEIALPPLRERLEDLSWIVQTALQRQDCRPHASLIELALRRSWPGNLRELLGALASAATSATRRGDSLVRQDDLPRSAGVAIGVHAETTVAEAASDDEAPTSPLPTDDVLQAALEKEQGNVARTARTLGLSRGQVRRWLIKKAIDPKTFAKI
jgi:transcriptional regulator with PAS, ATPase and Fis domain